MAIMVWVERNKRTELGLLGLNGEEEELIKDRKRKNSWIKVKWRE